MMVDVRFRAVQPSAPLREHAVQRVYAQLGRFGEVIRAVRLHVSDENGPKGGPDKRVVVSVRCRGHGTVVVDDVSGDAYSTVDTAIARAARALHRGFARARHTRRPS